MREIKILICKEIQQGYKFSPQGFQSSIHILSDGENEYKYDSFSDWPIGEQRKVSVSIDRGFVENPRRVK